MREADDGHSGSGVLLDSFLSQCEGSGSAENISSRAFDHFVIWILSGMIWMGSRSFITFPLAGAY